MQAHNALAVVLRGDASQDRPTLVLMHFLGGSLREWDEVVELLGDDFQTLAVDLPGFGGSAGATGYSVAEMADAVEAAIAAAGLSRYVLVGHSMGGKVAAVIARRLEDAGSKELAGLVLIASSPPGPEPMEEEKRGSMIERLGHPDSDDVVRAHGYISKNELREIPKRIEDRAVDELLRMNRTAWTAWLTQGSREDWRDRVGVLNVPALVIAGEQDSPLGPEGQRRETMPHLGNGRLVVFENCSHLVPMEQPEELAAVLREFAGSLAADSPRVLEEYRKFLAGSRVSNRTREVLQRRMTGPKQSDTVLNAAQQRTLRAALARVLPQPGENAIDLTRAVMARLAAGENDGWRYAALPDDLAAYRMMLERLEADGFSEAAPDRQDKLLSRLSAETDSADARWFEDLRADAAAAWAAHPQTMARIGFSGPGVGGANTAARGYVELSANRREAWEPEPADEFRSDATEFRGDDTRDGR